MAGEIAFGQHHPEKNETGFWSQLHASSADWVIVDIVPQCQLLFSKFQPKIPHHISASCTWPWPPLAFAHDRQVVCRGQLRQPLGSVRMVAHWSPPELPQQLWQSGAVAGLLLLPLFADFTQSGTEHPSTTFQKVGLVTQGACADSEIGPLSSQPSRLDLAAHNAPLHGHRCADMYSADQ